MKNTLAWTFLVLTLTACAPEKDSSTVFLAKELCSCRFLVGQSKAGCRDDVRLALLVGDATIDEAKKEVTATSEDKSKIATFRYVSAKYGCELK
ncbi:MAG: hypothetical protein KF799_14780 [Bdellovibrionales bacterium]|nr:hypothetical protein [Bdellovibrionales bacterium]